MEKRLKGNVNLLQDTVNYVDYSIVTIDRIKSFVNNEFDRFFWKDNGFMLKYEPIK